CAIQMSSCFSRCLRVPIDMRDILRTMPVDTSVLSAHESRLAPRAVRNFYITKDWIVSVAARRIYLTAAGLSLAFLLLLIALQFVGEVPVPWVPIVRALVFAGVVGTATTMVAMEYFLFGFDKSSAFKKAFWFCIMLFPVLGAALYCFIVYSRSDAFTSAG
ncbi:MAG: hypothetical protein LAN64_04775, partial [Acidobacteriia bacterium]|nr:hypothetical protein [Terriglobia bacterium]